MPEFRITDLIKGKSKQKKDSSKENSTESVEQRAERKAGSFRITDLIKKSSQTDPSSKPDSLTSPPKKNDDVEQSKAQQVFRISDFFSSKSTIQDQSLSPQNIETPKKAKKPVVPRATAAQPAAPDDFISKTRSTSTPPTLTQHHNSNSQNGLLTIIYITLRYRWLVLVITLAFPIFSTALSKKKRNPYVATSKLFFEEINQSNQKKKHAFLDPIVLYTDTVLRIALTPDCSELTFANLKNAIAHHPKKELLQKELQNLSPDNIQSLTNCIPKGENEDIIDINGYHFNSPESAVLIANSHAQAILSSINAFTVKEYNRQLVDLDENILQNAQEITNAENELYLLLDPEEGLKLNSSQKHLSQKHDKLKRLVKAHKEKVVQLRGELTEIQKNLGLLPPLEPRDIVWVDIKNPIYYQWQKKTIELNQKLSSLQPDSPMIVKLKNEIQKLKDVIFPPRNQPTRYLESTRFNQNKVVRLKELNKALENATNHYQQQQKALVVFIQQMIDSSEEQNLINKLSDRLEYLEVYRQKLHETKRQITIMKASVQSGYQVMDWAKFASQKQSESILKKAATGTGIGFLIGLFIAVSMYKFENKPKYTRDLESKFNHRFKIIGAIPNWKHGNKVISYHDIDTPKGKMYSILRNNLRYCGPHDGAQAIFITSPLQDDGKTLTAINMAISSAMEKEKTVLVSTDLRTPKSLTSIITSPEHHFGIAEYLKNDKLSVDDVIHPSSFEHLDVIPTFGILSNPTRFLTSERLKQLLEVLASRYSVVMVDTPAVLPVVDTSSIIPLAKTIILVTKADKTKYEEIKLVASRFANTGTKIHGIVLNGIQRMSLEKFYGPQAKEFKSEA